MLAINLPHRSTPDLLAGVLPLWLHQTIPTVVDVVDTGSTPAELDEVRRICAAAGDRVRLHILAPRRWSHLSEPIAIACELSVLFAATEKVLWSHVDVFPRRADLAQHWSELCDAETPAVGYEISSRDHVGGWIADNWRGMLGHSLTIGHLPTLRRKRVQWGYEFAREEFHLDDNELRHWDTEVTFNLGLRRAHIHPRLIGHDLNLTHLVDEWHGHARSYPSAKVSGADHLATATPWVAEELRAVPSTLARWRAANWK